LLRAAAREASRGRAALVLFALASAACGTYHPAPPMTSPAFLDEGASLGASSSDASHDEEEADAPPPFELAKGAAPSTPDVVAESAPTLPVATFREPMPESLGASTPAVAYAKLSAKACKAELAKRKLPVAPSKSAQRGVTTAERIEGDMNDVHLVLPPDSTKFGVLDCRLALVIDDLTKAVHQAGVARITIDNTYRPNAKLPGKSKRSQHAFGLAIDVTSFTMTDGRVLSTAGWGATIGEVPCGPNAVMASPTKESIEVRNLVCSIARAGFFNTVLSPSFNAAHQSHFHFDIKEDTTRATVR
jgi:hypothetical protein